MKSLMLLWISLANESARRCCTSATLDIKYVERRTKHEGISFLTISLPSFGKDFEKSLDQGRVERNLFQGYTWQTGLPRFLGGFLARVFDTDGGVLLDDPDIDAILAVRQLTLMYNKILIPSTPARRQKAMDGYVQCEQDVREADRRISDQQWSDFHRVSSLLFSQTFSEVDQMVFDRTLLPKHGPGATADYFSGNRKYKHSTWPARLERYFPMGEYIIPNYRFIDRLDEIDVLEPGEEIPVRVISVPKTLKTPRIIGIEPVAMQYCQQAILGSLLSSIRRDDNLRRMLGFNDQEVNHQMAREGSLKGNLATLDLSEASDRVSNQHVRNLLSDFIELHDAVDSCRSRKADVDGHGVIRLAKFASMGSALCFPFEAMVFLTLIFLGIEKELSTRLTRKTIKSFRDRVRVYGDDIIIPVDMVHSVIPMLESFGIRVNRSKSFWNGKFRESCGGEFYDGHNVSIVRVRREVPESLRDDPEKIISLVSFRNQLYYAGYWETCKMLDDHLRGILRYYPVVLSSSQVLGRESFLGFDSEKIHEDYHSPLVKGWVISAKSPLDPLEDDFALTKCLMMLERRDFDKSLSHEDIELNTTNFLRHLDGLPTVETGHLERSGRPSLVRIKKRWASSI